MKKVKSLIKNSLEQTHPFYLYLLLFLIIIILVWGWHQYFYEKLLVEEQRCLIAITSLEKQQLLIPELVYQTKHLQRKHELTVTSLKTNLLRLPETDLCLQLERVLSDISESGLKVKAFEPQGTKRKSFYNCMLLNIKSTGDFWRMLTFLKKLNEQQLPTKFKRGVMRRMGDDLEFDSVIALYMIEKE